MEINRVKFQTPDILGMTEKGFSSVDMHMHSRYSDTYTRIRNIIKKARMSGIGVSITDHNEVKGSINAVKNNKGALVIPGIEVGGVQGSHVLFYFYKLGDLTSFHKKHVEKHKLGNPYTITSAKVEDLIINSKNFNSVVCLAHPFGPTVLNTVKHIEKNRIDKQILKHVDLVEVICGQGIRRINVKALDWASKINKGFIGGSDAHTLDNVGTVLTHAKADNINDFLDLVKKKKNLVSGKETRMINRAISYSKLTNKHLRYLAPTIKSRYDIHLRDGIRKIQPGIKRRIERIKDRLQ